MASMNVPACPKPPPNCAMYDEWVSSHAYTPSLRMRG